MFTKEEVMVFFDRLSSSWDKNEVDKSFMIEQILTRAHVLDCSVLDVACGTGILFPYYEARNCQVTALDLSLGMVEEARKKTKDKNIEVIHTSLEEFDSSQVFDVVMIYNAFPHFINYQETINHALSLTKKQGYLSIAHSLSKKRLDEMHQNKANPVSQMLPELQDLISFFPKSCTVVYANSDDEHYQLVIKKN